LRVFGTPVGPEAGRVWRRPLSHIHDLDVTPFDARTLGTISDDDLHSQPLIEPHYVPRSQ
jgi:hypothetical protein